MADTQTDVQAIIATARSGQTPYNWNVWPLRRDRLLRGIGSWAFTAVFGLIILGIALYAMIPANFERGLTVGALSFGALMLFALMGVGGSIFLVADLGRLRLLGEYLLIMTPEDFVKVEPRRITHVPMDQIEDVTLKGVTIQRGAEVVAQPPLGAFGVLSLGRRFNGILVRKPREAPSLAFRDRRTNRVVVVATDDSYDDLGALEQVLQSHLSAVRRRRRV